MADTCCAVIALAGAPNAGKSTLLNRLIGQKVSIVSPKVQTTRTRVTGILVEDNTQLVFIDTPGIFSPRKRLDDAMVRAAWDGVSGADLAMLLVDAKRGITKEVELILTGLRKQEGSAVRPVLLLNKVDVVPKETLLPLVDSLTKDELFSDTFMISALKGDGVEDLKTFLKKVAKPGPFLYPEDQASDMPMRLFAAEITREKLFYRLDKELPYALMVETEQWEEQKNGSIKINQVIYVMKDSQKGIILGKGGNRIKEVGAAARRELEEITGKKVHLFLFVKVKENWQDVRDSYHHLGLEFPT